MAFFDIFVSKTEQHSSVQKIGSFESSLNNIREVFISTLSSMGMSNPQSYTSSSSKAITIKKKGNKYEITLNMFKPPLIINWTGLIDINKLESVIEKLVQDKKKIGYINTFKLQNGVELFQLAVA